MKVKRERRFDRAKDAKWRGIMKKFAKSGLSIREFCRQNEISEASFHSWKRTLAERDRHSDANGQLELRSRAEGSQASAALASVAVLDAPVDSGDWVPAMEITFGDVQVRIDRGCPTILMETILSGMGLANHSNGEQSC